MKLFIIGNGFDLAHCLKTRYECFKLYLEYGEDCYNDLYEYSESIEKWLDSQGKVVESDIIDDCSDTVPVYDEADNRYDAEVRTWFLKIMSESDLEDEKWSDYEKDLGLISFDSSVDSVYDVLDKNDEKDDWKTAEDNEDMAANAKLAIKHIHSLFIQWIKNVELNEMNRVVKDQYIANAIDIDSLFFTFNYTDTLEKVYGIYPSRIMHIHGKINEQSQESGMNMANIILGHGNSGSTEYDTVTPGTLGLDEIHRELYKNVPENIDNNNHYFQKLNSISQVYIYGFSFGGVDRPYLEEIIKSISPSTSWIIASKDNREYREQREILNNMLINNNIDPVISQFLLN